MLPMHENDFGAEKKLKCMLHILLAKKATKNQIQLNTSHKGYYYFINNN